MTLDLFSPAQLEPTRATTGKRIAKPTIEERFLSWSKANQHVLVELLRLARVLLAQGAEYISAKALWEVCRVSLARIEDGVPAEMTADTVVEPYKLNNTFTACAARWLLEQEPRLVGVIETRIRRAK